VPGKSSAARSHAAVFALLGSASAMCLALVLGRSAFSHTSHFQFLVWNLFLAWVPLVLAAVIYRVATRRGDLARLIIVPAAIVWLLFFPNALYIVDRLRAPRSVPRQRPGLVRRDAHRLVCLDRALARCRVAATHAGDRGASRGEHRRLAARSVRHGGGQRGHLLRPLSALEQLGRVSGSPGAGRHRLGSREPARRGGAHARLRGPVRAAVLFVYATVYLLARPRDEQL